LAVQTDFVGLYNATAYEFWSSKSTSDSGQAIVVLEVGIKASDVVLASPRWIRYRSIPIGTERMNRAIITQLQLTQAKADLVRQQPSKARWMYQLDEALTPQFRELLASVQHTLAAFQNDGLNVDDCLLTGGGAGQHGLLRYFVFGE
jgi:Tfp pilus assembly PilM family ATPase